MTDPLSQASGIPSTDFLEYIYQDGSLPGTACSGNGNANYTSADSCWSLDDSSPAGTLTGQGDELHSFLEGRPSNDEVTIIAHSQGGVLATYVSSHWQDDAVKRIQAIVTLDSPLQGIPSGFGGLVDGVVGCDNADRKHDSASDMEWSSDVIHDVRNGPTGNYVPGVYSVDETGGFDFPVPGPLTSVNWEVGHLAVQTGNHDSILNGTGDSQQTSRLVFWIKCAVLGPSAVPLGDVNCDGQANGGDLGCVLRNIIGLGGGECIGGRDINCDGRIDASDALALLKYLVGIGSIPDCRVQLTPPTVSMTCGWRLPGPFPGDQINCIVTESHGQIDSYSWSAPGASPNSGSADHWSGPYGSPGNYTVSLVVCNSSGCSQPSEEAIHIFAHGSPPAAPSHLTVTPLDPHSIQVSWQDNSANEDGFEIADCVPPLNQPGCVIDRQVGPNVVSYVVGGLDPGTYKCFSIRSFNTYGTSNWSPSYVCATTPTPTLTVLPVTHVDASSHSPSQDGCGYVPQNLFDGTGCIWATVNGDSVGAWLQISLAGQHRVTKLRFLSFGAGNINTRIQDATLKFSDGSTQSIHLQDVGVWQDIDISPVTTDSIRLTVDTTYRGTRYPGADILVLEEMEIWGY